MKITFTKKSYKSEEKDDFGNIIPTIEEIEVDDCLVGPVVEPVSQREQLAISQGKIQVRVHLPKAFDGDVSDSDFEYGGKKFHLDSDSVEFMKENCPTRWNRYFRAESHYE